MRRVLIFFCVLILSHCGNSKQVYWCGDHPCVNEKERESYFKENMIVEIRDIKKIKKQTKSEVKKIKEDLKKKEKLDKEKQKELKKQAKIEEKIALEESKNIKIKNKNKSMPATKKEIKASKKEIINKSAKKSVIENNEFYSKSKSFDDIYESIINNKKMDSYPDINRKFE